MKTSWMTQPTENGTLRPLPRSGGEIVMCDHYRCTRDTGPHYLPWLKSLGKPPPCPIDGTDLVMDFKDSWCVPGYWDKTMEFFENSPRQEPK